MPLESATYISDLDPTNPVGSSDLVSSLDDHMRLVKATLKNTFPGISGAVTASHTELNHLDGVTGATGTGKLVLDNAPTIADLTVTDSITLPAKSVSDAALSDNVALLDKAVAFESTLSVAGAATFSTTIAVAGSATIGGNLTLTGTLNGVNVADFARLSQGNPFTANQKISVANEVYLRLDDTTAGAGLRQFGIVTADGSLYLASIADNDAYGKTAIQIAKDSSQNITLVDIIGATILLTGAVTAATIATSTSTTLTAGRVHAVTSNATLPDMAAGQWVGVINNSASPITVTKHASDTMYWTASGASVTSVTVAARGKATFFCADGGNVYASGNITGAS